MRVSDLVYESRGLALRLVLTEAPDTLVFDEVDAGVGGAAAEAVGAALAGLGHHAQVLVVNWESKIPERPAAPEKAVGGKRRRGS